MHAHRARKEDDGWLSTGSRFAERVVSSRPMVVWTESACRADRMFRESVALAVGSNDPERLAIRIASYYDRHNSPSSVILECLSTNSRASRELGFNTRLSLPGTIPSNVRLERSVISTEPTHRQVRRWWLHLQLPLHQPAPGTPYLDSRPCGRGATVLALALGLGERPDREAPLPWTLLG